MYCTGVCKKAQRKRDMTKNPRVKYQRSSWFFVHFKSSLAEAKCNTQQILTWTVNGYQTFQDPHIDLSAWLTAALVLKDTKYMKVTLVKRTCSMLNPKWRTEEDFVQPRVIQQALWVPQHVTRGGTIQTLNKEQSRQPEENSRDP